MQKRSWWTPDTIFVSALGVMMMVIFGASLFAHLGSKTGSALVPAKLLQELRDRAAHCQTVEDQTNDGDDEEAVATPAPRARC